MTMGNGAQTQDNRSKLDIPKTHALPPALDAARVAKVSKLIDWNQPTLGIKSMGRGTRQRTLVTAQGFPRENKNGQKARRSREKEIPGLRTGPLVEAVIPEGKAQGYPQGRVGLRKSGRFDIKTN
ncbi:MAG: hypothetical protein LBR11_07750 [Deltaproteobacteria bacterium]|jgi:hypothetical protein|nr:hypothetical protein [Deltaproteobacteria bacterium]